MQNSPKLLKIVIYLTELLIGLLFSIIQIVYNDDKLIKIISAYISIFSFVIIIITFLIFHFSMYFKLRKYLNIKNGNKRKIKLECISKSCVNDRLKEFRYKAIFEIIIKKFTNKIIINGEFFDMNGNKTSCSLSEKVNFKIENDCLTINYEYKNNPNQNNNLFNHNGFGTFIFKKDNNEIVEYSYFNNLKERFSRGYSIKEEFN